MLALGLMSLALLLATGASVEGAAASMPAYVADGLLSEIRDEPERREEKRAPELPGLLAGGEKAT